MMIKGGSPSRRLGHIILVASLIVVPLLMSSAWAGDDVFVHCEDFESYSEGVRPPDLQLTRAGSGVQDQVVTTSIAYNGSKSFQMRGEEGRWAVLDYYFVNGGEIALRAALMSENFTHSNTSSGLCNINVAMGFSIKGTNEFYGSILFADDGNIIMRDGSETFILMPYEPLEWYDCLLRLNCTTGAISTFVDGELLVSSALNVDAHDIDAISLGSGESGIKGYVDDLCLTVVPWSNKTTVTGALYPIPLVPMAAILIAALGFLMFRQVRSSYALPKRVLRIEDIMKAFGMGAPLLSMGLIITINNGAFGDLHRDAMLFGGIFIMSVTLLMIFFILNKMRLER